jgi:hypothetical protein
MAYLDLLARDCAQFETCGGAPQPLQLRDDPAAIRVLQAVLMEIEHAGVFIASSTSITTAMLCKPPVPVDINCLKSHSPAAPQIYPAVAGACSPPRPGSID